MAYQVVNKSNHTFWLMTSNGNWISSHHSHDEAIAACRAWFKCTPIIRKSQHHQLSPLESVLKNLKTALLATIRFVRQTMELGLPHTNVTSHPIKR